MSEPIGKGDWVECAPPPGYRGEIPRAEVKTAGQYPRRGGVYCVREVGQYRTFRGLEPGLRLSGIVASIPGRPDCWWPAHCFRALYRPKGKQLIRDLLQPVREDA